MRSDGTIANAQVQLGTSTVMAGEASSRYPPMPGSYYRYVADMPYGDRQGGVRDPHVHI